MKKAVFSALLAVIMIFALVLVSGDNAGKLLSPGSKAASAGREGKPREIPETTIFTELMHAELGSGEDEIGYEQGNESEDIGPEDFFVEGDTVAVLDSVNKKIKFFTSGSYDRSIDISYMGYPYAMVKLRSFIYVQDYCLDNICKINAETGELVEKLPLPNGITSCLSIGFTTDGETVYLWDMEFGLHNVLSPSDQIYRPAEVRAENNMIIWQIPFAAKEYAFEGCAVRYLRVDKYNNVFFDVYEERSAESGFAMENTVCEYSIDGEPVAMARIPVEDNIFESGRHVLISDEGMVYYLACTPDGVTVYEIAPGKTVSASERSVSSEKANSKYAQEETFTRSGPAVTKTRDQVKYTAELYLPVTWTYQSGNDVARSNCKHPTWVNPNHTLGDTMHGVPYAWGRWDSKDEFVYNIAHNAGDGMLYMAGNIKKYNSDKTAGTDCSGYVSKAYGYNNKRGSSQLADYYTAIAKNDLRYMDYLVYSGHHVMLFVSMDTTMTIYTIYDATSNTAGKVAMRNVSISSLSSYVARTPWNVNCTAGNTYQYDELVHWNRCTDCGIIMNEQNHSFVYMNGRYVCSVCGYEQSF